MKHPLKIVSAAQGPVGIVDADGKAIAWFSDQFIPSKGYAWKPSENPAPDPDTHSGTTYFQERNEVVRKVFKLLNDGRK